MTGPADVETSGALAEGVVVGRYIVGKPIGSGAMGRVYAAYDPELDRKIAIKVLHDRVSAGSDLDSRVARNRRLQREAQAIAKLAHPNIVKVHDVGSIGGDGDDAGRVFIAMEHVEGTTLRHWLAECARSVDQVLGVFRPIAAALAHAHDVGIVHRDFKPDNVLIDPNGRPHVTDFGLARALPRDDGPASLSSLERPVDTDGVEVDETLTQTEGLAGTPAYMAPEQLRDRVADARSDQFAFCVSLYEALYGERPFRGKTIAALVSAVVGGDVRPVPAGARVPMRLRRVVLRGLAVDPGERFADMQRLRIALLRRRIPWPIATGVTVAAVVGAVATLPGASEQVGYCDRVAEQLDGVWDADVRAAVVSALSNSKLPFARESSALVIDKLDAYAERWLALQRDACEDDSEHVAGKMACLSTRREALAALTVLLKDGSDQAVLGAADAVARLPMLEPCARPGFAVADVPAEIAEDVDRIRIAATRVRTLRNAGMSRQALEEAETALRDAESVAHPPSLSEAALELANSLSDVGRLDEAEAAFHRALSAGVASSSHGIVSEAAAGLAFIATERDAPLQEVQRWVEIGNAALARGAKGGSRRRAQLVGALGTALREHRRLDEAAEVYVEGIRAMRSELSDDDAALAPLLAGLGLVYSRDGRQQDASALIDDARELLLHSYGSGHPHYAVTLQNLAITHFRQGAYTQALELYLASHESLLRVFGEDHPSPATTAYSAATALLYLGRYDEADEHAKVALRGYEASLGEGSMAAASGLALRGEIALRAGRLEDAEAVLRRAIALAEQHDEHGRGASYQSQLGRVLSLADRRQPAREALDAALAVQRVESGEVSADVAETLGRLAELDLADGAPKRGLSRARRSAEIYREVEQDPHVLAEVALRWARATELADAEDAERKAARAWVELTLEGMEALDECPTRIAESRSWLDALEAEP